MSTKKLLLVTCGALILVLIFSAVLKRSSKGISPTMTSGTAISSIQTEPAPPLTKLYKNPEYHFSVEMPADFSSSVLSTNENDARTILLQGQNGDGIQILISKYQSDAKTLTADDVRASIPDMSVADDQAVEIGNEYKGVAFLSDNEAFGGASREVWFVYKGQLYQISTYARLDPLLKAMFATWNFF